MKTKQPQDDKQKQPRMEASKFISVYMFTFYTSMQNIYIHYIYVGLERTCLPYTTFCHVVYYLTK